MPEQKQAKANAPKSLSRTLHQVDRVLHMILLRIAQAAILALVALVVFCVVVRYFNLPVNTSWAEEVPAMLVTLFAFLACAMGVRDRLHVGVGVLYVSLRPDGWGRKAMDLLTNLCVIGVSLLFILGGGQMILTQYQNGAVLMATGLPRWIQYVSIPVAGAMMLFDTLLFMTGVIPRGDRLYSSGQEVRPVPMVKHQRKGKPQRKEEKGL